MVKPCRVEDQQPICKRTLRFGCALIVLPSHRPIEKSRAVKRKTLLFVTDVFPFPLDRGQHVRIHNLLAACARSFDVTYVAPMPPVGVSRREVEQYCASVNYVRFDSPNSHLSAANVLGTIRLAPGLPTIAKIRYYGSYLDVMREVGPKKFDLVWAERPHIARLCADVCARTIIDLDDVEHIKVARQRHLQRGALTRIQSAYRYSFYKYLESVWSRKFLATVVCSDQDRDYLAGNGCKNAVVVPNAPNWRLNGDSYEIRRSATTPLKLVFLGNVDSVPNADAMELLAEEILPRLRSEVPNVTLDVIGPGATNAIRERYAGRIHFRGFVEDLGQALSEYDLMVAPLRFGSGTKLKVLDAMANELPVVTSHVGAEGLSLRHGKEAWIADEVPQVIEGIKRIKSDVGYAISLATNAKALVVDRFSWDSIQSRLSEWLENLASDSKVRHVP